MPVTTHSLATMPYKVGGIAVPGSQNNPPPVVVPPYAGPVKYRGVHTIYPTLSGRITHNLTPPIVGDARSTIGGNQDNNGDAYFLKYFDDEITSIRLPCPAPGGVLLFVTDNMSGCKFYVDTINGSPDLIVYHANTHQHTAGPIADADFQQPAAAIVLDGLHAAAQGDYAGLVLNNVAQCAMPTYFQNAGQAERRKRQQGRLSSGHNPLPGAGPKFMGGCTIVGFPHAGTWQFWYQTWGDLNYLRPSGTKAVAKSLFTFHWHHLHKLRVDGKKHVASYATMEVIDCRQIY
ncbi:MAG: hypothetical protein H6974_05155 [Gammaproteobacteria bacterium]|nr:hypothetical protein [Gammaproteobacteria bacterium]MCP5196168.1 hypothetical protein [Gammaproteobacteria bacterium]